MRAAISLFILLGAAIAASAQSTEPMIADRPGIAEGSTVVGSGVAQLESGIRWEKRDAERQSFVPVLLRIGVGDRFEARVESDTLSFASAPGSHFSGLSPFALGFKQVIVAARGGPLNVSAVGRLYPPSGSGGFHEDIWSGDIGLAADWDLGEHWTLTPSAGIGWYDDDPGRPAQALVAATLYYESTRRIDWFVDIASELPEVPLGHSGVTLDGGLLFRLTNNLQIDIGGGSRAHGDTPPRPFLTAGISMRSR